MYPLKVFTCGMYGTGVRREGETIPPFQALVQTCSIDPREGALSVFARTLPIAVPLIAY